MSYRFTVVLTVYRRVGLLARALYSVLAQDEPSWELVVVADGPHPDAEELVHDFVLYRPEYQDRIGYLTVERDPGGWGNRARRQGLLHARGEYTCFLGHDCLLASSYLATHRASIEAAGRPVLSVVGVEYWRSDDLGGLPRERYVGTMPLAIRPPAQWAVGDLDLTCMAFPTACAVRRDVFAGGSESSYYADVEGFLACRAELPVAYNKAVVAAHF